MASGFDWKSLVANLAQAERSPQNAMRQEQYDIQQRNIAYGSLKTQLQIVQNRVDVLKDPTLFDSRSSSVGDSSILTASVTTGAPTGSYSVNISQLATSSKQNGTSDVGAKLSATDSVSGLTLANAGFASDITAGTISVNGKKITIATTDSLQDVFTNINTATGGAVTASYNSTNDTISFSSSGTIVLGSASDTSNFLEAAKLRNNGTGTIESAAKLGAVRTSRALASSNLATAVSDGGSGAGSFKINGVAISFNTSSDSLTNVMDRINASDAGVTAAYDTVNDRLVLTNKKTGDLGVGLEDVTGNFLAATGLSGGTLSRGKDLNYSINGGGTLVSHSNVIDQTTSGLAGLTMTALKESTTTVQVSSDTSKIKSAITDFLTEYNKIQSMIDTNTASSTDAKGKVTAGILAGESDADDIATKLRGLTFSENSSFATTMNHLADLGITSSGKDNSLTLSNSTTLDTALSGNLTAVKNLFSDSTNGIGAKLHKFIDGVVGDKGSLVAKQNTLTTQSSGIDTQIANQEKFVLQEKDRLTASFVAMEAAQQALSQQLAFLNKTFA